MLCIGPGDDGAWGYQSCTENLHQFGARGPIRDYTFAVASIASICAKVFNGTSVLDSTALATRYGGYKLADVPGVVSNVIWSNGVLLHCHCICLTLVTCGACPVQSSLLAMVVIVMVVVVMMVVALT